MPKKRKQNQGESARIVVEYKEGTGTTVRVEKALSPEHAVWMLAQSIQIIVTQGDAKVDEPVQELPDTDGTEEEAPVPDVQ